MPSLVPCAVGELPEVLASCMAALHSLDPQCVRGQLSSAGDVPTLADLLGALRDMAAGYGRPDLAETARWLIGNPAPPAPDDICHGDLHPFNLLADGEQVTVVDWSAALLAPRAYDVAVTTLLLAEPPLRVRGALRAHGARRQLSRYLDGGQDLPALLAVLFQAAAIGVGNADLCRAVAGVPDEGKRSRSRRT